MLRRPASRFIVNSLDADTVKVLADGTIVIAGVTQFKAADVKNCYKSCPSDGQTKRVLVGIAIPQVCECPPDYAITIDCTPDLVEYETNNTFNNSRLYQYEHPVGGALVASATAAALVSQINSDVGGCVTATQTDSGGTANASGTFILLESKDETKDFKVFNPAGTVEVLQAFVRVRLSERDLQRAFPIKPGDFGSNPTLTRCGDYCVYHLRIVNCCSDLSDARDISMDRAIQGEEQEYYFYVKNDLATFAAHWDDKLQDELPCLADETSGSGSASA